MTKPQEIILTTNPEGCWITAGSISIRVYRTDEGVICDMYSKGMYPHDPDEAHLASCGVTFSEASVWPHK
jgi:hypothetical protein